MRQIKLNITDVLTTDEHIVIHGTHENSSEEVEVVIPIKQIPAITGVLEPDEEKKPTKKGAK